MNLKPPFDRILEIARRIEDSFIGNDEYPAQQEEMLKLSRELMTTCYTACGITPPMPCATCEGWAYHSPYCANATP